MLIPRPRLRARVLSTDSKYSLLNQMRLQKERQLFDNFTSMMRSLVKSHIDLHKPLREQKEHIAKLVTEKFPRIREYEEQWPIDVHLRVYLTNSAILTREKCNAFFSGSPRCGRRRMAGSPSVRRSRSTSLPASACHRNTAVNRLGSRSPSIAHPISCPVSNFLLSLKPAQPGLVEAELVHEGKLTWLQSALISVALHKYVKTTRTRTVTVSDEDFSSTNAVHNFLMNIIPPLPHLIPRFSKLGIVDETTLRAAARLEGRDVRLKRLAAQRVLTPLEAHLIGEAMAELAKGEPTTWSKVC
ncbi:hypothetical protein NM688_g1698 [Phlebia brevispora]|uniref:Uncharacterized protein n=1 Tax=Phlebia brevispora TaxID=194682 RepID=A0ACC1TB03_9APHY|nr:hypothetical protein NM688_g1698 [Phlebia brevispora]